MSNRNKFTPEQARIAGRKGGKAWRISSWPRTQEYKAGYQAGWKAASRKNSGASVAHLTPR